MKRKGLAGLTAEEVVALVVGLAIALFALVFLVTTSQAAKDTASCSGMFKYLASLMADMVGDSFC